MSRPPVGTAPSTPIDDLLDRVSGDPDLKNTERETTFTFAADRDRVRVHSAVPAVVRGVLAHDESLLLRATVYDGGGVRTVAGGEVGDTVGDIVSIRATLPLGALSVKARPRKSNQPGDLVSERVFDE